MCTIRVIPVIQPKAMSEYIELCSSEACVEYMHLFDCQSKITLQAAASVELITNIYYNPWTHTQIKNLVG